MSRRETIWRVAFGGIGVGLLVYAALHVFEPKMALVAAFASALSLFLALADTVENI